jgi:hypothetical protein
MPIQAMPRIMYDRNGNVQEAQKLKGRACAIWTDLVSEVSRGDVKAGKILKRLEAGVTIDFRYHTDAYGQVNGTATIFVPGGQVVEQDCGGFLGIKNGFPINVYFFPTSTKGFKAIQTNSTLKAGLLAWHNTKTTITWVANKIYYLGVEHTILGFTESILAAAVDVKLNKVFVFARNSSSATATFSIFSLSSFTLIASNTVVFSGVNGTALYINRIRSACFNHNGTKLVFISNRNVFTGIQALPFSTALTNTSGVPTPFCDIVGLTGNYYNTLTHPSDATLKALWESIYRFDIDTTNNTIALNSYTNQLPIHVFKSHTVTTNVYNYTSGAISVGTTDADYTTQTETAIPVYDTPYVHSIWYSKTGVEQTRVCTTSCELSVTTTMNGIGTYTNSPPTAWVVASDYSRSISYSASQKLTDALNVLEEFSYVTGTSSGHKESTVSLNLPPFFTLLTTGYGTNSEERGSNFFVRVVGENQYVNNPILIADEWSYTPFNDTTSTPGTTAFKYNVAKTRKATSRKTIFNMLFNAIAGIVQGVSGVINSDTSYPQINGTVFPHFFTGSGTITATNEYFIMFPAKGQYLPSDIVQVYADKCGNMIYTMANNLTSPTQTGAKAFNKDFAIDPKNTQIDAILEFPSDMKGVI